jgi:hypothetical protein
VTVNAAGWLVTDPALATMVTVPGETPVTRPLLSMVATPAKLLNHEMAIPGTGLPEESKAVAVNCCVLFTATELDIGEIVTVATFVVTVNVTALLVTLPPVAVICVVPPDTPVATPFASTVATLVALLAHATVPDNALLFASTGAAKNVCDCPTAIVAVAGVTVIFVMVVEVDEDDEPLPQPANPKLKKTAITPSNMFAQRGPSLSMIPLPQ